MRDLVSSVVFIAEHSTQDWEHTKTLKDLLVKAKWVGGTYTVTCEFEIPKKNRKMISNIFQKKKKIFQGETNSFLFSLEPS